MIFFVPGHHIKTSVKRRDDTSLLYQKMKILVLANVKSAIGGRAADATKALKTYTYSAFFGSLKPSPYLFIKPKK